jgi:hypothetical protein
VAAVAIRLVVDHAAIRRITHGQDGEVAGDMGRRGRNIESDAKRRCPVLDGRLRASITSEVEVSVVGVTVRVGSNAAHALWVHEGTGIYGPTGRPITPVRSRYLSWQPRGGGRRVFVKSTRGMRGRPYLRDALGAGAR